MPVSGGCDEVAAGQGEELGQAGDKVRLGEKEDCDDDGLVLRAQRQRSQLRKSQIRLRDLQVDGGH